MSENDILKMLVEIKVMLIELLGKVPEPPGLGEIVAGVPASGPLTHEQAKLFASSSPVLSLLGMEWLEDKEKAVWKFGSTALGMFGLSTFYRDVA